MPEQELVTRDSSQITSDDRAGDESHMAAVVLGHEPLLWASARGEGSIVLVF
jgi:hypothetical protein